MATDLAKLVVSLEAETARYQKELEKARGQLDKFEKQSSGAATVVEELFDEIARLASAAALPALAKALIDNADRLAKLSQSTGVAVESLSQLDYAAGLSGASSEDLAAALNRLNKSAAEAAQGGKSQAEAFGALGVAVKDAQGNMRSTEDLLTDVAEAFSQIEDGPAKAAVAMDLFGKSGANLIPFLNNGRKGLSDLRGEAHQFGLTVSGEASKAAEEFNDNLDRLRAAAAGAANQITSEMLPTFAALTDSAVDFAKHSGAARAVVDGLRVAFETIVVLGANVAYVLTGIGREIGGIAAQAAAVARLDFGAAGEIGRMMREDAAAARKEIDAFSQRVLNAHANAEQVRGTIAKWSTAIGEAKTGGLEKQREVMRGLAAAYQANEFGAVGSAEAIRAYQSAVDQALPAIQKKRLALAAAGGEAAAAASKMRNLVASLQEQAATMGMSAEQVELYRLQVAGASAAQLRFAAGVLEGKRAYEEQQAALAEGKGLTEQLRTPTEALGAEYARLDDLLKRNAIDQETFNRAVAAAQNAFIAANPEMQEAIEKHRELNALLASTPTGKLEKQRGLMLDLAGAYERGELGAVGSAEAMARYSEAAQTALGTLPAAAEQSTDLMQELTAEAARNMQGALADFLFDPAKDGFEGMGDAFAAALQRMAAEAAAARIFEALGFGAGGKGGGMDGILGSLASAAIGAFAGTQAPAPVSEASPTPIPGRAGGGGMRAGRPYWTGEAGPELVFPGSTSRILSARDSAEFMGAGSREVYQTFNITTPNPDAFRASERQIARKARGALQR